MNLTVKVLLGMALGIVVGLAINLGGLSPAGSFVNEYLVDGLFLVVGKLFVNALKMMVVPLVLFSLICGVCGIGDIRLLGRIGTKAFVLYILTTAIAIATGILLAAGLGIGEGMNAVTETVFTGKDSPPLSEVLINIVPSNPVSAMATGEMLAIIFFAILCGVGMLMVGKKAQPVVEFVELLNEVMMKMVTIIMALAPYAVFCLLAKAIGSLGLDLLVKLIGYVAVLISVLLFHLFVTLQVILKIFSGLSSMTFLKKMRNVQVFAFSTSSSNATIPVTLRTVTERLGVKNSVASFTVPFGATINMDGTAIMQGVATVFIANVYGVDLGFGGYLTVILMSVGLGLFIMGWYGEDANQRASGMRVMKIGAILFVIFGIFFESIFNSWSFSRFIFPVALILVGGYLVLSRAGILPNQKKMEEPASVDSSQPQQ